MMTVVDDDFTAPNIVSYAIENSNGLDDMSKIALLLTSGEWYLVCSAEA